MYICTGKLIYRNTVQRTRMQLHLYQPDHSEVAEHSTESGHWIKFREIEVLARTWTDLQRSNRNRIRSKEKGRFQTLQSIECEHQFTKAFQHTCNMKIPRRQQREHKKENNIV